MVAAYASQRRELDGRTAQPVAGQAYQTRGRNRMFELHPDGDHIVLAARAGTSGRRKRNAAAQFVFNFFEELRRLAPADPSSTHQP